MSLKLETARLRFIEAYAMWTKAALLPRDLGEPREKVKAREALWDAYCSARDGWERACEEARHMRTFEDDLLLTPLRGEIAH